MSTDQVITIEIVVTTRDGKQRNSVVFHNHDESRDDYKKRAHKAMRELLLGFSKEGLL